MNLLGIGSVKKINKTMVSYLFDALMLLTTLSMQLYRRDSEKDFFLSAPDQISENILAAVA